MQKPVRWPDGLVTLNRFRLHAWAQRSILKFAGASQKHYLRGIAGTCFWTKGLSCLGFTGRQAGPRIDDDVACC